MASRVPKPATAALSFSADSIFPNRSIAAQPSLGSRLAADLPVPCSLQAWSTGASAVRWPACLVPLQHAALALMIWRSLVASRTMSE